MSLELNCGWWAMKTDDGQVYFANSQTGECAWEYPADATEELQNGWHKCFDETSFMIYYLHTSGDSSWDCPKDAICQADVHSQSPPGVLGHEVMQRDRSVSPAPSTYSGPCDCSLDNLVAALRCGDVSSCSIMLAAGVNMAAEEASERCLKSVCESGMPQCLDILLESGVQLPSGKTRNALYLDALRSGSVRMCQALEERGCNVASSGPAATKVCLLTAARAGHLRIVQHVLSLVTDSVGWDSIVDKQEKNCLHLACEAGSLSLTMWLLEQRPHPPLVNTESGMTALMYAAQSGSTSLVEGLLGSGLVEVNDKDHDDGYTALGHAAAARQLADADTVTMAQLLLGQGADASLISKYDKQLPMHTAANAKKPLTVTTLLQHARAHGIAVNSTTQDESTVLHLAAEVGCTLTVAECLRWVDGRSDALGLDDEDEDGKTPLLRAGAWHAFHAVGGGGCSEEIT